MGAARQDNKDVNPWLSIPASDYEGHMGSNKVGQLKFLSEVFQKVLQEFRPSSLAVLGCATGNGFEHIAPEKTKRVVAVDINPSYLDVLCSRFSVQLPHMEVVCSDVRQCSFQPDSFDLIHGALFFEYVDPGPVLASLARWLRPSGLLSVVLQMPSSNGSVTETEFASLKNLQAIMKLVDPLKFRTLASREGFQEVGTGLVELPTGKEFLTAYFQLET